MCTDLKVYMHYMTAGIHDRLRKRTSESNDSACRPNRVLLHMVVVCVSREVQPLVETIIADRFKWVDAEVSEDAVHIVRRERIPRARLRSVLYPKERCT